MLLQETSFRSALSKAELGAKLDDPRGQNFCWLQPGCSVPGVVRQDRARVEGIEDVEHADQARAPEGEGPRQADIELSDAILELRVGRHQIDHDVAGARRVGAALSQVATERRPDDRVAGDVGRGNGNTWKILVSRAG